MNGELVIEELLTMEQFRDAMRRPHGCIVISDKDTQEDGPIAHHRESGCLSEDTFELKVVLGGGNQGRYWWAKNSVIAGRELGARRCRHPQDAFSKQ